MLQAWIKLQKRSDLYKTKSYLLNCGNGTAVNFVKQVDLIARNQLGGYR